MLCEDCKEREANIHFTQVVNDEKTVINLCSSCAEKRGFQNPLKNIPFPLGDFLASIVETSDSPETLRSIVCPKCGLTFEQFSKIGRMGCGDCYAAFGTHLDELLRKIHGANRHSGKLPSLDPEKMAPLQEERKLREALRLAIEREDFEKAAELRDELKELFAKQE